MTMKHSLLIVPNSNATAVVALNLFAKQILMHSIRTTVNCSEVGSRTNGVFASKCCGDICHAIGTSLNSVYFITTSNKNVIKMLRVLFRNGFVALRNVRISFKLNWIELNWNLDFNNIIEFSEWRANTSHIQSIRIVFKGVRWRNCSPGRFSVHHDSGVSKTAKRTRRGTPITVNWNETPIEWSNRRTNVNHNSNKFQIDVSKPKTGNAREWFAVEHICRKIFEKNVHRTTWNVRHIDK